MFAVVLCTTPASDIEKIAHTLVEEKLVACINIAAVNSIFRWEGKVEEEEEALLVMKTKANKLKQVIERVKTLHSYEVPEVIALPIIDGNTDYTDWISESLE